MSLFLLLGGGGAGVEPGYVLGLQWDGGSSLCYFAVQHEGYAGSKSSVPRKAERSLDDGTGRMRQESAAFREFQGALEVKAAGTCGARVLGGESVPEGSWDDLLAAYEADDLECIGSFDAEWWPCAWLGDTLADPRYDPLLSRVVVPVRLVGIGEEP